MQQVFGMCSMLLQRNTDTRKRKLNIRRYKVLQIVLHCEQRGGGGGEASSSCPSPQVVPFSQRSGVLEWCSGTVPIGQFLVDPDQGAHKRFRPQDWTNLSCRRRMMVGMMAAAWPGSWAAAAVLLTAALAHRRLLPASRRSSRPTARCVATSGPSSGTSAWSASWTRRCGWRNGWPTPAA